MGLVIFLIPQKPFRLRMKRDADHLESDIPATRPRITPHVIEEYQPLTENYDFSVCSDKKQGKYIQADIDISKDSDILIESPLICWPFATSANCWDLVTFCEHCLKFLSSNSQLVPQSPTKNELSSPRSLSCSLSTKETTTLSIPFGGEFCSSKCRSIAMDGGIEDSRFGWFTIIGGTAGLQQLRLSDWCTSERGGHFVVQCPSPISNEALARYICEIARRYCLLKQRLEITSTNLVVDDNVENEIFKEAGRVFERLVTPALVNDFDCNAVSNLLQSTLGDRLSLYLPPRLVKLLLQPLSITQIWCQLVVNSQKLTIWGSDKNGYLSILQGGGVYTLHSCFNHSCEPNSAVTCSVDSTITVSTVEPIASGEHLTISYISQELSFKQRRQLLAEGYLFVCECGRCRSEGAEPPIPQ